MRIVILIGAFLFFSCSRSVPKDVLPPPEMQAVLWDMMRADEMANFYADKDSSYNNVGRYIDNYQTILSLHRVSKEDFKKSFDYYLEHPEKLKPILDSVYSQAERFQKGDTLKKPYKAIIDSAKFK